MTTHNIEPHLFVVLGATSDLMRRKLLPALYQLQASGAVTRPPDHPGGVPKTGLTDEGFRAWP